MPRIRRKVTRTGAKPRKRERRVRKPKELTEAQIARKRAEDELMAQRLRNRVQHIIIPAGLPPFDLEGDDLESISQWVSKLKTTGHHTVQSCQWWTKYFYDPFDQKQQWRDVRQKILDNHKELGIPNIPANYNKSDDSEESEE